MPTSLYSTAAISKNSQTQTNTSFSYSWNHLVSSQILWESRSLFISIIYPSIYLNLSPCITVDQQSTSFGADEFSLRVLSIETAERADATSESVAVWGAHFSGSDWWSEKWREWKSMTSSGQKVSQLSGTALMWCIVIRTEMIFGSALSLVMRVWKCVTFSQE